MRLLTKNPGKCCRASGDCGIRISERLPVEVEPNEHNLRYLVAKRDRMGHLLQQLA